MSEAPFEAGTDFDAAGQPAMGTDPDGDQTTPTGPEPSEAGQPDADAAGTTGDTGTPAEEITATEETFFDPAILDEHPELKVPYKNMQRAFGKKTEALKTDQKSVDAFKAFENQFAADPVKTIERLAQSQGLQITRPGAAPEGPKAFDQGWEPQSWADVQKGLMAAVDEKYGPMISGAIKPLNEKLSSIENKDFEASLDALAPEWREYEQDVADVLTMAPGLMRDPEKLLRASLPQAVIDTRAMQAALKRIKTQSDSTKVGGSSTSTKRPEEEPDKKLTFAESVESAKKEMGWD